MSRWSHPTPTTSYLVTAMQHGKVALPDDPVRDKRPGEAVLPCEFTKVRWNLVVHQHGECAVIIIESAHSIPNTDHAITCYAIRLVLTESPTVRIAMISYTCGTLIT